MESPLSGIKEWIELEEPNQQTRDIALALFEAIQLGNLCIEGNLPSSTSLPLVQKGEKLYFSRYLELENRLLSHFKELTTSKVDQLLHKPDLSESGLTLEQENAIEQALNQRLFFITGGPGTGKTHTAGLLVAEILKQKPNFRVAIAAPTGKAVGQLKKSLSRHIPEDSFDALTLHRLLQSYRDDVPLIPYDVLLVDESSMIDLEIMVRCFEALKTGARLIMMGDPWQLPPVEAGAVFADLALTAPRAHLTKCLRAELKEIVEVSELIKNQDADGLINLLKNSHPKSAIVWKNDPLFNFTVSDMPILTPLKKGKWGAEGINLKGLKERKTGPIPIIITRNHYGLELYNGDLGTLSSPHPVPGEIAQFGAREIPALLLPSWDLAWALSIHKSQGSEFDSVRIVLPEGSEEAGVAALYTAVTRAKKYCEIWASEETLRRMMHNSPTRLSGIV